MTNWLEPTRSKKAEDSTSSRPWDSFHAHCNSLLLFSCSVVSNSLWPHRLQHTRLSYPSPSPGVCSNSCPLSRWCHPTTSSSNPVVPHRGPEPSCASDGTWTHNELCNPWAYTIWHTHQWDDRYEADSERPKMDSGPIPGNLFPLSQ